MTRVSIIVPMRNCEAYVQVALSSLLTQGLSDLEIVVVDDGSTDRSRERVLAIGDPRVRVLDGPEQGIAAALNTGLAAVRGEIVMRCDADDRFEPERIRRQVAWLSRNPEFGALSGSFATMDARGRFLREMNCGDRAEEITSELLEGRVRTSLCTFAMRTEHLQTIGGARDYFVTAEDIDLQLRLAEICRIQYLPEPTYHYRLHDGSVTHSQPSDERQFYEGLAYSIFRQRRAGLPDDLQRLETPPPYRGTRRPASAAVHIQEILLGEAWRLHSAGHRASALLTGLRASLAAPTRARAWASAGMLIVKRSRSVYPSSRLFTKPQAPPASAEHL